MLPMRQQVCKCILSCSCSFTLSTNCTHSDFTSFCHLNKPIYKLIRQCQLPVNRKVLEVPFILRLPQNSSSNCCLIGCWSPLLSFVMVFVVLLGPSNLVATYFLNEIISLCYLFSNICTSFHESVLEQYFLNLS